VDLEERARGLVAALDGAGTLDGFVGSGCAFELGGRLVGRQAFLDALGQVGPVRDVAVKRNVTFVWTAAGVLAISWDQDGRVAHLALHAG
jgi:hypothetical protein